MSYQSPNGQCESNDGNTKHWSSREKSTAGLIRSLADSRTTRRCSLHSFTRCQFCQWQMYTHYKSGGAPCKAHPVLFQLLFYVEIITSLTVVQRTVTLHSTAFTAHNYCYAVAVMLSRQQISLHYEVKTKETQLQSKKKSSGKLFKNWYNLHYHIIVLLPVIAMHMHMSDYLTAVRLSIHLCVDDICGLTQSNWTQPQTVFNIITYYYYSSFLTKTTSNEW